MTNEVDNIFDSVTIGKTQANTPNNNVNSVDVVNDNIGKKVSTSNLSFDVYINSGKNVQSFKGNDPDFPHNYGVRAGYWLPYNTSAGRGDGPILWSRDMQKVSNVQRPDSMTGQFHDYRKALTNAAYKASPINYIDNVAKKDGMLKAITQGGLSMGAGGALLGLLSTAFRKWRNPHSDASYLTGMIKGGLGLGGAGAVLGYLLANEYDNANYYKTIQDQMLDVSDLKSKRIPSSDSITSVVNSFTGKA